MAAVAPATAAAEVDVAIVGGGMVGASLAAALWGTGVRVLLVESVPFGTGTQPSFDERTTALGNASRRIFEAIGVWPAIASEAAAIRSIHVSEAGRFCFSRLTASEQGVDAFGYVVANRAIGAALWQKLSSSSAPQLLLRMPAHVQDLEIGDARVRFTLERGSGAAEHIVAQLVVAADGAHSQIRAAAGIAADVEDYDQVAVVANVATDRAHEGRAFERFTREGPLAVLPLHDGTWAVIWACRPAHAARLLSLDEAAYLARLQAQFGWRAGRFVAVSRRGSYPLRLTRAATTVGVRTVLIGNAAQALHPVAGQGFNLGLRDAALLAEVLANTAGDVGSAALLRGFAQWRARDREGVVRFTDGLVKLFADHRPGMSLLRSLGLLMFDLAPPAKSALARVSPHRSPPMPRSRRVSSRCRAPASTCCAARAPGGVSPGRASRPTSACASGMRAWHRTARRCWYSMPRTWASPTWATSSRIACCRAPCSRRSRRLADTSSPPRSSRSRSRQRGSASSPTAAGSRRAWSSGPMAHRRASGRRLASPPKSPAIDRRRSSRRSPPRGPMRRPRGSASCATARSPFCRSPMARALSCGRRTMSSRRGSSQRATTPSLQSSTAPRIARSAPRDCAVPACRSRCSVSTRSTTSCRAWRSLEMPRTWCTRSPGRA